MQFSHAKQFMLKLEREPGQKLSFLRLIEVLGPPWTEEKVRQKAAEFNDDLSVPLWTVHGGVQYLGSEKYISPGLYQEIRCGIEKRWARDMHIPRPEVHP